MSFRNPNGSYIRPGYDPLEVSNPPTGASATAGSASASVSFTAPTNTGGSSITNYYAVSSPGQITASSVTSPISVTGLTNGTSYTFRVWAANSYGPSAYSAPTGSVTPAPNYIEDVFSTYLYAGNSTGGGTQIIANGIDLANKGGMIWIKGRNAASNNVLFDTARGRGTSASDNQALSSNLTSAQDLGTTSDFVEMFYEGGFAVTQGGGTTATRSTNYNNVNYVSWTFRKQEKFFDVVTYTGDGTGTRNISHNLGSVPGCIIVKATNQTQNWIVYHQSLGATKFLYLNTTAAEGTSSNPWSDTTPTSTVFTTGTGTNASGYDYVAYLFAHDAGGFGDSGSDNVITCGSYTGNGTTTGPTVNLGYEPQWILVKRATVSTGQWEIYDSMRGMTVGDNEAILRPNTDGAEFSTVNRITPTSTGFFASDSDGDVNANGSVYIYIAIRRGPMKTPTNATSVFDINYPGTYNPDSTLLTVGFPSDHVLYVPFLQNSGSKTPIWYARLMGSYALTSNSANGESGWGSPTWANQTQFAPNYAGNAGVSVLYYFLRAPKFFDVVCYSGTGANRTINHNLGVAPELMIVKRRDAVSATGWIVYAAPLANAATSYLVLNLTDAVGTNNTVLWNSTAPTSSVFSLGTSSNLNASGSTNVAYLFATLAGISKVGSYTGNGSSQTINCGFTGGARFVMIKRTDSTGDWVVFDTARGMVSGNDPYFALNNTDRDVTDKDAVDTDNTGFIVNETTGPNINVNGGTYIFLAIA